MMRERVQLAQQLEANKYFSNEYVRTKILKQMNKNKKK